jgi:hypothetical protein
MVESAWSGAFRAAVAARGHKLVDGGLVEFGAGQVIWRLEGGRLRRRLRKPSRPAGCGILTVMLAYASPHRTRSDIMVDHAVDAGCVDCAVGEKRRRRNRKDALGVDRKHGICFCLEGRRFCDDQGFAALLASAREWRRFDLLRLN